MLEIQNVSKTFNAGTVNEKTALNGLNLKLNEGDFVTVIGGNGAGKSTMLNAVAGVWPVDCGKIIIDGVDVTRLSEHQRAAYIGRVFQDPMTSLDPTMTIGKQIMEGMLWHFKMPKAEAYQKALKLLEEVGITDAEKRMKSYPHQLSGGMRQRVVIAIALSCDPDLLICDEPTTALDVTIQAKILELIRSIQKERGISVIYITHDLGVVAKVADYVDVMYAGKIVETGTIDEIFYDPKHPIHGVCCRPCPTWIPPTSVCTPSPVRRPTCCMRRPATPLHPATSTRWRSTTRSTRPCSRSATPTLQRLGCWTPVPPRWRCRRS